MLRLFFIVILGTGFFAGPGFAQDDYAGTTSAFQDVLSNLKESVTKLATDNDQLAARDTAIKQQVLQLQAQLGQLEAQGVLLERKAARWRDNNPGRAQPFEAPPPDTRAGESRQKEKLKLMKMIYDSQQRQEMLQERPSANGEAQWDDTQQRQLESELKVLEKNYVQLKDLMDQLGKKSQSVQLTVSQRIEGEKLQGSIDDLNRQGVGLKSDLDDLRSQMVDLDKRKSQLEVMIKKLP